MNLKTTLLLLIILYCSRTVTGQVPIRASITNGTSAIFIDAASYVYTNNTAVAGISANYSIPPQFGYGQLGYIGNGPQTSTFDNPFLGYSYNTMKQSVEYSSSSPLNYMCGLAEYMFHSDSKYNNVLLCYNLGASCTAGIVYSQTIPGLSTANYNSTYFIAALPPRAFYSSATGTLIGNAQTNSGFTIFDNWLNGLSSQAQFTFIFPYTPTKNNLFFSGTTQSSTYVYQYPYNDYPAPSNNTDLIFTSYAFGPSLFYVTGWNVNTNALYSQSNFGGYKLLHYYSNAKGVSTQLPVLVLASSSNVVLATAVNGDLSFNSGLQVLTSAPIVGCAPDFGTIINWNNLANPYPNTVHLYTMCQFTVTSSTVAATGAVYEIYFNSTFMNFTRWKALPIHTAIDLQIIGEYNHILTTVDTSASPPLSNTPGLYSLYDPYTPAYIGYATLDAAQNPANTVNPTYFFSITGQMANSGCGSPDGQYLVSQFHSGIASATLSFCGSGNTQWNNATYCDGISGCCGDYCQYSVSCSNYTNVTECLVGYCSPANGTCLTEPAVNGTYCADGGPCAGNSTCYGGTCTAGAPVANGTIINNATVCQNEGYCNGTGYLVGGTYLPSTTVCDSGNVTYCVKPSNCTGSSSTCPTNAFEPNGSLCGVNKGICWHNNTCLNGVCQFGTPLANGTVIVAATACETAYYCDGAGNLVNGTFLPSTYVCNTGNVSFCVLPSNCTGNSSTCPANTFATNGTSCSGGSAGICYGNSTCQGGTCQLGTPLANGTIISNATVCQNMSYCDGAGVVIGGGYLPASTVCSTANLTICRAAANCTGNSSSCPSTSIVPDGTLCANKTTTDPCAGNSTCNNGTCVVTSSLPNGTDCSATYPCSYDAKCYSATCTPNGTKPAGTVCGTNATTGICAAGTQFCDGVSNLCSNSTAFMDGAVCDIVVSSLCNLTGNCLNGNCITNTTCPPSSSFNVVTIFATAMDTLSAPMSVIAGSAAAVGGFAVAALMFIFIILVLFPSGRKKSVQ